MKDIELVIGNRQITLARELTKKFEEFLRGNVNEAVEWAMNSEIRGEFCIVLEGNQEVPSEDEQAFWTSMTIEEHVDYIIEEMDISSKDAIKEVAKQRNLPKRDVYQAYHK